MKLLTNITFLYFIVIIYFIQLYYLIYMNENKSIFIFIISLLIVNVYCNNLIISILSSFIVLYSLYVLQLLNHKEPDVKDKQHYVLDIYEPKIENGLIFNDFYIEKENEKKEISDWLDMGYINEIINKSKLIVQ